MDDLKDDKHANAFFKDNGKMKNNNLYQDFKSEK